MLNQFTKKFKIEFEKPKLDLKKLAKIISQTWILKKDSQNIYQIIK